MQGLTEPPSHGKFAKQNNRNADAPTQTFIVRGKAGPRRIWFQFGRAAGTSGACNPSFVQESEEAREEEGRCCGCSTAAISPGVQRTDRHEARAWEKDGADPRNTCPATHSPPPSPIKAMLATVAAM
eukprot:CAMPEP_0174338200 /NCGR_PEP_ID=MMETSP0810-20121108/22964_1 /TAXON_ID=73025 ORGANISM="Eutreptiella gymnastica-like, Strain CCMP1594" /NCGR_SAMPLE_ID=MMETSP0810 /ASSEMBLY_ACC=CAM_ASM_000659 /LENGTH=126 /DNA_ID=CAMNT_0015458179 /DNA_START=691 /DNA_END=1071 /DNA_ORIENTATION=+